MTRHLEVLAMFRRLELEGYAPVSLADVGREMGLSKPTVHEHCQKLVDMWLMARDGCGSVQGHYRTVAACPTCGRR